MGGPLESSDSSSGFADVALLPGRWPREESRRPSSELPLQCWLSVILCGRGADTENHRVSKAASLKSCPFGDALCAKFIQMCSIVGEQILSWQIGFVKAHASVLPEAGLNARWGSLVVAGLLRHVYLQSERVLWLSIDVCCLATRSTWLDLHKS